jgi:L-lactate dehydrogenase (cytochrome)
MIIASIEDYRKRCEARLPRFLYDYISGGSYQENTLRGNIADLQATLLRQRVMVDESHLNLSIDLWDQTLSLPVVLGPVGMAGMYSSRGEVKAANAAKAVGETAVPEHIELEPVAVGAKACFVGRAWAYALGAAGEPGVRDTLDILKEELKVAMTLTGCSDVNRATRDLLLKD